MSEKYNLYYGLPPNQLINEEYFKEAFLHSYERDLDKRINDKYNYGEHQGDYDVRKCLANWYSKDTGCHLEPENIITNAGASYGIINSVLELVKPGECMLVECPSFFASFKVFIQENIILIPALRSKDGRFNFLELEDLIIKHNIKAFYTVTNYHNPTGINTKLEDRSKIYELASKHQFYVFSDDIYETLYYEKRTRLPPLIYCNQDTAEGRTDHLKTFDIEQNEYIISINSFSKVIFPQIKFGFVISHSKTVNRLISNPHSIMSIGYKSINEHVVRSYIELGLLDRIIEIQRKYIFDNFKKVYAILSQCPHLSFASPEGGYFVLIYLNEYVNVDNVYKKFEEKSIKVISGTRCVPEQFLDQFPHFKRSIRLCFSYIEPNLIEEAFKEVVDAINQCIS